MMWWGDGYSWGWMIFGGVMMILFWGGLIALAVVVIRGFTGVGFRSSGGGGSGLGDNSALEILKERYARGEISKSEYEEMRRDIST
ncbi:MAG TPA: SHOCT domain-containing protein [Anaerolineales bacterium]|nr:SHOCT domain-containing protein [Anaerolineales bacterium]